MSLFEELKRRRVFRVAAAYVIGAWIVLQVADTLFPALHLPAWTVTLVAVLVIVGFPAALLLGWAFDLTPGGVERASGNFKFPLRAAVVGTIIVAVGVGAFALIRRRAVASVGDRSVAVLPFANLSGDPNDAFFADGVQDEILTHLARIAALDVRSRTSMLEYRNTTKNLKQIAQELSVRYILEGSVRRAGDNTRITAQLIDAHTDKHVWADTYDGTRDDVFGMQTSVAQNIAKVLAAELTPAERSRLAAKPTENADAHELYLKALDYSQRSQDESDYRAALALATKATELDPKYAQAWAMMGETRSLLYWMHYDRSDTIQAAAAQAARRALELDPSLPDAHAAMGEYLYRVKLDYDGAQKELRRALEAAPGEARYVFTLAAVLRRKGDFQGALAEFQRTVELDPRSSPAAQNLAETYHVLHRPDDARPMYDRAMALAPGNANVVTNALYMDFLQTGDMTRARRILSGLPRNATTGIAAAKIELFERNPDAAISLLQSMPDTIEQNQFHFRPNSLLLGIAYERKGDVANARTYFKRALNTIDAELKRLPDDPRLHSARGIVLAALGDKQQAIAEGVRATTLMPIEKDAWRGTGFQHALSVIYVRTGEHEKAIDILQKLLSIPSDVGRSALQKDPSFDALRSNPRFQALIK